MENQYNIQKLSSSKCFETRVERYSHISPTLGNTVTKFHVIVPPQIKHTRVPVLFFLAGLTCNDETFVLYSGAQRYAAYYGIFIVCPDTSPRNTGIEGEDREYNFGSSAGFYVNASVPPWSQYYQMFDYVTKELPQVIEANFAVDIQRQSIFGHSMGGHGALICALRHSKQYRSVSALAPVSNPINCSFGRKCLRGYLGNDREAWKQYDATELVKRLGSVFPDILIDQGTQDEFLKDQLLVTNFEQACKESGQKITLRMQKDYDHEYNFVSTVVQDHVEYHNKALNAKPNMQTTTTSSTGGGGSGDESYQAREQEKFLPTANIARIMKKALPPSAKIAKDGKDTVQECVSEFVSFITSEASDKCQREKRKTINGDDILWAMNTLGFDNYVEPLKIYLARYREAMASEKGDEGRSRKAPSEDGSSSN
eukprot:jgi/Galph1/1153/GphlegSOOS_G5869.1